MSFKAPNHTQTPNDLFALLPEMGEAELKVTLVVVRDTFGWQQGGAATARSLTELMKLTGLSKQGVLNGLKAGKERGTLYQVKGGRTDAYGLVVNEVDQSISLTGQPSRPQLVNLVDRPGQPSRPQVVNEVDRSTPAGGAPGAEKPDAERQQKERERKGKTVTAGESPRLSASAAAAGNPNLGSTASGTVGAGTPAGDPEANARPASGAQSEGGHGTGQATTTEKVPGAALAALTAALAPMRVPDLLEEYTTRAGWLDLEPARIRELATQARDAHGRNFRGALIEELDAEARKVRVSANPNTPAPKASASDLVRARLQGAKK